jgi:hypothetical protein
MGNGELHEFEQNYTQFKERIEKLLGTYDFQEVETYKQFKDAIRFLEIANIYIHRIDWLVSSDDNEAEFHKRLAEDLKEAKVDRP